MNRCPEFSHLLVLPHLRIQNANAISSPLTHGFPSITAFSGLMWALERKTRSLGLDLSFKAVGLICHDHQEQVNDGYIKAFSLTRNPTGKDGRTAAIVEEGRIHLELSLILAVTSERWCEEPAIQEHDREAVAQTLNNMRLAGGTFLPPPDKHRHQPYIVDLTGAEHDRLAEFRRARLRMLPGFTLVCRDDLIDARLNQLQQDNPEATRLEAWLSLCRINWSYQTDTRDPEKGQWVDDRKGLGWIVPIPVGYGALSELYPPGNVVNARDMKAPFRFVENLYSIGQWISPHRLSAPEEMLWYADYCPEGGLYRLRNDYYMARSRHETFFE